MSVSVSEQLYIFLATLYGGILIRFIYDLYRIFRGIFKPKKIATTIQDLVFWIFTSIVAVCVLLFSNSGQLRLYNFIGFMLGSILYAKLLSRFVIRVILYCLRGIKRILSTMVKMVMAPIKFAVNWVKRPWRWLKKRLRPYYYRLKRIVSLPRRSLQEAKKYVKTIMKKK